MRQTTLAALAFVRIRLSEVVLWLSHVRKRSENVKFRSLVSATRRRRLFRFVGRNETRVSPACVKPY